MAARLLQDDNAERADFPIVCETCLGPNPYVRMQRFENGAECHISGRPYTKFRWCPGPGARYKATIICQEVAKAKNVCQVCLLDLEYGIPVQARDTALGVEDESLPESDVGKEFRLKEMENAGLLESSFSKAKPSDSLLKMQRTTPYYKRNAPQICSFFVKGECKRGAECPYRHEMPSTGPLAKQNIKDRYYGVNDPVADKMLNRVNAMPKVLPPEDPTITTLYVGGIADEVQESDLRDYFYPYGEITSIKIIANRHCAFVTYAERSAAERAVDELQHKLIVRGQRCKLMWGKPQEKKLPIEARDPAGADMLPSGPPPSSMIPPQVAMQMGPGPGYPGGPPPPNFFNLPPGGGMYPSMDPSQAGTRAQRGDGSEAGPAGGAKRPRPNGDMGYGPGPGFGPPPGYNGGPPPGAFFGRPPWAGPGNFGGPPPGWRPPMGAAPRPAGGPPAAAPPQAATQS